MAEIKTSKNGIDYLIGILKDGPRTLTRATLWKITHNTDRVAISLKVGRYTKKKGVFSEYEELENQIPKSELTLTNEEFLSLIQFLQNNYEPFKKGIKKYLPIDSKLSDENIELTRSLFLSPEREEVLRTIIDNQIIPEDIILGIQLAKKAKAVDEFEMMLSKDISENDWQKWFEENSWVLGTEFVRIIDERTIDTENISDFLMEAYDGFLDIVEIKRPNGGLKFWNINKDHDNYVPHQDLIKAITQASRYIYEVERESNSDKFLRRVSNVRTIKPRCILIFGRSKDWDSEQKESYRILNSNFHNLAVLTYDHVLERAKILLS